MNLSQIEPIGYVLAGVAVAKFGGDALSENVETAQTTPALRPALIAGLGLLAFYKGYQAAGAGLIAIGAYEGYAVYQGVDPAAPGLGGAAPEGLPPAPAPAPVPALGSGSKPRTIAVGEIGGIPADPGPGFTGTGPSLSTSILGAAADPPANQGGVVQYIQDGWGRLFGSATSDGGVRVYPGRGSDAGIRVYPHALPPHRR